MGATCIMRHVIRHNLGNQVQQVVHRASLLAAHCIFGPNLTCHVAQVLVPPARCCLLSMYISALKSPYVLSADEG